jgi:hypothetical protein
MEKVEHFLAKKAWTRYSSLIGISVAGRSRSGSGRGQTAQP